MVINLPLAELSVLGPLLWASTAIWSGIEATMVVRDIRAGIATRANQDRGSGQKVVVAYATAMGVALLCWRSLPGIALPGPFARSLPGLALPGPVEVWAVVGICLMWLGFGLRLWAIHTLGKFFRLVVLIQDDHALIQDGPYRWLRHPSYTGSLMTALGFGIALHNLGSVLAVLLIPLLGFVPRMNAEESALLGSMGEPYQRYLDRTKRLIPKVW